MRAFWRLLWVAVIVAIATIVVDAKKKKKSKSKSSKSKYSLSDPDGKHTEMAIKVCKHAPAIVISPYACFSAARVSMTQIPPSSL